MNLIVMHFFQNKLENHRNNVFTNILRFVSFFYFIAFISSHYLIELKFNLLPFLQIAIFILFVFSLIKINAVAMSISFIVIMFYFINQFYWQEGVFGFINILGSLVVAHLLVSNVLKSKDILLVLYYLILILVIKYHISFDDYDFISIAYNLNHIAINASRNIISIDIMFLLTIYYLSFYIENNKNLKYLPILPALIPVLFCALSGSRMGLLSSIMFLIVLVLSNLHLKKRYAMIVFVFFAGISSLYLVFVNGNFSFSQNVRHDIVKESIKNIDSLSFFIGFRLANSDLADLFASNLHNSYLMFFAYTGFASILVYLVFLLCCCLLLSKRHFIPVIIVFPFFVRMFTDSGLFMSIFDSTVYFMIAASFSLGTKHLKITA